MKTLFNPNAEEGNQGGPKSPVEITFYAKSKEPKLVAHYVDAEGERQKRESARFEMIVAFAAFRIGTNTDAPNNLFSGFWTNHKAPTKVFKDTGTAEAPKPELFLEGCYSDIKEKVKEAGGNLVLDLMGVLKGTGTFVSLRIQGVQLFHFNNWRTKEGISFAELPLLVVDYADYKEMENKKNKKEPFLIPTFSADGIEPEDHELIAGLDMDSLAEFYNYKMSIGNEEAEEEAQEESNDQGGNPGETAEEAHEEAENAEGTEGKTEDGLPFTD